MTVKEAGWVLNHEPWNHNKLPDKPRKILELVTYEPFCTVDYEFECRDIALPKGKTWNDIAISSSEGDIVITLNIVDRTKVQNKMYGVQLVEYKEKMKEYKAKEKLYREELVNWSCWAKEEQNRIKEAELKLAEDLLIAAGRTVL